MEEDSPLRPNILAVKNNKLLFQIADLCCCHKSNEALPSAVQHQQRGYCKLTHSITTAPATLSSLATTVKGSSKEALMKDSVLYCTCHQD